REIFQYINDKGLLLNNEHPKDWACRYFYHVRCQQVQVPVYGFNATSGVALARPVPLWSLVWHDCCITGGDTPLLQTMNGSPAVVRLDDADAPEVIDWVKRQSRLQAAVMFDEMTAHKLVSEDNAIQETEFASGVRVRIDQSRNTVKVTGAAGIREDELAVPGHAGRR
ncbi:MAG TPA: hypothetical protein VMY39_07100, partial [Planctomycetota bacterium]|nr:hypothetical protein [Planctomycetota bacterium]